MILESIERELFAYIGGILKKHDSILLAAGGTENHVHLLIAQSKNIALSDLIREIKKASSLWIKSKGKEFKHFQWQAGFGSFSVGKSQIGDVKKYIGNQKEHHESVSFEDEYEKILLKYEVEFDRRYFLD
jgi:REP element-mobilizing transposase RayT